jgi:predicted phosphodiesterase
VISDIHGRYKELKELIERRKVDFNKDVIYFLGDYADRGPDSLEVLRYIKKLDETYENVHCTFGNHDFMMFKTILGERYKLSIYDITFNDQWELNGKTTTLLSLMAADEGEIDDICSWMSKLNEQFEITVDDRKYVLTHSTPRMSEDQSIELMLWTRVHVDRFDWEAFKTKYPDTTLISGHTPVHHIVRYGGINKVYFDKKYPYINVDCGAGRIGLNERARLALLNLSTKRASYSK